jgi:hypothetical protein
MPIGDHHRVNTRQVVARPNVKPAATLPKTEPAQEPADKVELGQSAAPSEAKPKSLLGKFLGLFHRNPPTREWTVLFYANGNSDLQHKEEEKLSRLGEAGSSKTTTIVAQMSQGSRDGVGQRFEIARKSWGDVTTGSHELKLKEELGRVNVGDGKTFKDALLWAHKKYPAKQYMVILGGHGEGARGALHDDLHGDRLEAHELAEGFDALSEARGGKKTEVVVADSCLLGAGELGYQLRDSSQYYVASEEVIGTADINFRDLGKGMRKKGLEARDAADVVMNSADSLTSTLSVVDLSKMDDLGKAMKGFKTALEQSGAGDRTRLEQLADKTQDFMRHDDSLAKDHPFKGYRDLGHFAQLVRGDKSLENQSLREAAGVVFKAVGTAVVRNHTGVGYEQAHGISMNIATANQKGPGEYYSDLAMSKDTGWSGKLESSSPQV